MTHELTIRETKEMMWDCFLKSKYSDSMLEDEELFFHIRWWDHIKLGCNISSEGGWDSIIEEFRHCDMPAAGEDKVVVVINPAEPVGFEVIQAVSELCRSKFLNAKSFLLPDYDCGLFSDDDKQDCLTVVVYNERPPRNRSCSIGTDYKYMLQDEKRTVKTLQTEFDNEQKYKLLSEEITRERLDALWTDHHLLGYSAASSNSSIEDLVEEMESDINDGWGRYDYSGALLFVSLDDRFSSLEEIADLKKRIPSILGSDIDLATDIIIRPAAIKSISCRLYLFGNPKYVDGEVFYDFGKYEVLLYETEDRKRGHILVAHYYEDELTISRYDWGDYEANRQGTTDEHYYFDKENTEKFFAALKAKRPETFLKRLRDRFPSERLGSRVTSKITGFCKERGIDYHYECYFY